MFLFNMEQLSVYNSINFSYAAMWSYGAYANVTAVSTVINSFLCPSDANVDKGGPPIQGVAGPAGWGGSLTYPPNINSYRGSVGTTTSIYNGPPNTGYACCQPDPLNIAGGMPFGKPNSTGMFVYWLSYGIQDCTDGSSNTVLFAEAMVGDPTGNPMTSSYLRSNNGVTGVTTAAGAELNDASSVSYLGVIVPAINACTTAYKANTNVSVVVGNRWAWGAVGQTLFNTVVPPNGAPWNNCRDQCTAAAPTTHSSPLLRAIILAVPTCS